MAPQPKRKYRFEPNYERELLDYMLMFVNNVPAMNPDQPHREVFVYSETLLESKVRPDLRGGK